jgi:hypothetical protein
LLDAYLGRPDPLAARELRIFKAASSLREALWALIQTVTSTLAFDYEAYAEEHLQAYRSARACLDDVPRARAAAGAQTASLAPR